AIPEVEADGHVNQDAGHPRQHGVECLELEVPADLGTHELEPPDLHVAARRLAEGGQYPLRQRLRIVPGLVQPDQVFLGVAELLDDRVAAQADLVETLAHRLHGDWLVETHLHERAAREVDSVGQTSAKEDRDQAQQDEPAREEVEPPTLADEIVIGVDEDLQHARPYMEM